MIAVLGFAIFIYMFCDLANKWKQKENGLLFTACIILVVLLIAYLGYWYDAEQIIKQTIRK